MVESDVTAFASIMHGLAENFGSQLSENGIMMRFEALRKFDIEDVKKASMGILISRRFTSMPTIADFLDNLGGGRVEDIAELEAAKVWQTLSRVGGWKSVVFDDATTQAVIQYTFGGWIKLCSEMMEDQQKWFIKDFVRAYGAYSRQNVNFYGLLPGRGVGEPVLIGNQDKALQIMGTAQESLYLSSIPEVKRLMQFNAEGKIEWTTHEAATVDSGRMGGGRGL